MSPESFSGEPPQVPHLGRGSLKRKDIPTVSPAKNSLEYFLSIACISHPVWRSHREEAKRGPFSGHRIPRNGAAMVSLLLSYATTGLSLIAGWCLIGATPRGQPRTPAMRLPHGCEGLRERRRTVWWTFRRPSWGAQCPANSCATRCSICPL